ncbi:MAG: KOW motif-containing protein [candidate division WOR-3 bacterium]|nr:KOW motif-containing protein [candidate division WOR-3 bacterium]MCX7947540.1 KOW motif-containing protein [candidate division WOR-3 bacterium]MDW8150426.1 transcription termination/antitermination NusG family protein [candidate division WOR-3 bacterium]
MQTKEKVWIVFHTRTGREKKVKKIIENLIKNMNLEDKISKVLVPVETVEKTKQLKGGIIKRVRIEKPIPQYKGYIFVEMEEDPNLVDLIVKATSMKALLSKDEEGNWEFTTLTQEQIKHIEEIVARENERKKLQSPFVKGEKVKIVAGPFKDREGEVIDVMPEKSKMKVRIDIFGRPTEVEIDFIQAERIS